MTQNELIEELVKQTGIKSKDVKAVILSLGEIVCAAIGDNQEVVLPKIGKVKAKLRPARNGRNIQTGEPVVYPAKSVPSITIAKALKDSAALAF